MLRSMPVRRFKRGFKLGLIKLLIGNKAAGVHLSYVGQGASADPVSYTHLTLPTICSV